jgi:LysM repeat protein
MIAEDPDRYGFWMPKRLRIQPTEKVYITQCIDLAAIAECANIDVETLRGLNPALLRTTTPPGGDSTLVRLPAGSIAMGFWDRLASVPAAKKTDLVIHTVRRGETIGAIAASYGVPIDVIAEYPDNHIGRRYLLQVGQNLVIPVASGDSHKRSVARKQPKPSIDDGIHVVARGETLMEISRQTGITVERLAALNGLTNTTTIFPGQILKLDGTPPAELAALASGKDSQHIVSSGDTLWQIAKKYGVSVEALRKVNGLHARSLIKPGQKLAIPVVN